MITPLLGGGPAFRSASGEAPTGRLVRSGGRRPESVRGAEEPDLVHLDVGVFRPRYCGAGNPPVGTGQTCGQVSPGSGLPVLPGEARTRDHLAVCRLPEPNKVAFLAKDHGVVPSPHHRPSAVRSGGYGHQVTGRNPIGPWRGEGRSERNGRNLLRPENATRVLLNLQNDSATQQRGSAGLICRTSHSPSVSLAPSSRQSISARRTAVMSSHTKPRQAS